MRRSTSPSSRWSCRCSARCSPRWSAGRWPPGSIALRRQPGCRSVIAGAAPRAGARRAASISYHLGGWDPSHRHRVPGRHRQRPDPRPRLGRRRRRSRPSRAAASPPKSRTTGSPGSTPCTSVALAGLLGIADHRRRLQRLRLPRDIVAVELRADRHRPRPAGAGRRLPVPDHGHHRRDLLRHRRRPPLHDDRHAQSRASSPSGSPPSSRRGRSLRRSPSSSSASASSWRSFRSTSGCPTPTPTRRRSRPSSSPRPRPRSRSTSSPASSTRSSAPSFVFAELPCRRVLIALLDRRDLRRRDRRRLPVRPEADVRLFVGRRRSATSPSASRSRP